MKIIMRTLIILFSVTLIVQVFPGFGQKEFANIPFRNGEQLKYRVHYGLINAGEATISIDNKYHVVNNSECYRVNVFGRTTGAFDWVLRVRDTWRSYIDKNTLASQKFYRHIEEGGYFTEETTIFDRKKQKAKVLEVKREGVIKRDTSYNIMEFTQDLVSGFYYIRALDFNKMKPGHLIPVNAFFEDSTYSAEIKYLGKETLRTKFGKKNAHVFTPIIPNNELFEHGENTVKVYFSDDRNRIPLKIKASMFIGSVECSLKSYKGLRERL